jgi:hypothetical protein
VPKLAGARRNAAGFGPGQDPLYTGTTMLRDPGAMPSATVGLRWTSDDGKDGFNAVMGTLNCLAAAAATASTSALRGQFLRIERQDELESQERIKR